MYMLIRIYQVLLRLDGPILVSDGWMVRGIKSKILKPIGRYYRQKYFNKIINL